MKRLMTILLLSTFVFTVSAGDVAKEYQKLIALYDVPKEARSEMNCSPEMFWQAAIGGDKDLAKFNKDIKKGKGAEKQAIMEEMQLPHFYPEYDQYIVRSHQGYCDSILNDMGIDQLGVDCSFHIINSPDPDVFSALTDNGFAICITENLYEHEKMSDDIIKGYVAREFAHGVLRHRLRALYADAKKERKDRLISGIVLGVGVSAVVAVDAVVGDDTPVVYADPLYYPDEQPANGDSDDDGKEVIENLKDNLKKNTLVYSFNFTRGQVFEADMMAYRYLENIGNPDAYFDGLKILGARYDAQFATMPDHPTIAERISFMQYVESNPDCARD